ncbi:hypothetical protein QBC35DRAFT_496117 [Podospora australis]|uniref:Uncharacterized protein n=1 Tax=Podospora australis TaxID=1536484 RepID=A0AAN7AII7_9PEZI|nr:hypothetical protein QBC35DRAFT_496117 [Podospora australis]
MLAYPAPQQNTMELDTQSGFGTDHHYRNNNHTTHHHQQQQPHHTFAVPQTQPQPLQRKRKSDAPPENNERLSKRMSLLNLERSGPKLYVPVEQGNTPQHDGSSLLPVQPKAVRSSNIDDDSMHLDDSKYKVYIYNLDDELSSSDNETDDGKLVFLPDIEKHLRTNRIPASVLVQPDADLASKQLVLYRVPTSLTIPEEQDSVRKAIIEARARMREKQNAEQGVAATTSSPIPPVGDLAMDADVASSSSHHLITRAEGYEESDPDAMELD